MTELGPLLLARDDPALLSLYTAEAGHWLAGFTGGASGHSGNGAGGLRVFVKALPTFLTPDDATLPNGPLKPLRSRCPWAATS